MTSKKQMTGGCLCTSVRYQASPAPNTAYYCHCRDCQIGSGSAFHAGVSTDKADFHLISGTVTTYTKVADSGNRITRAFCPYCGTPLYWTGEKYPDQIIVTISSLDDAGLIAPRKEVWTDRALSWRHIPDDIDHYRGPSK